MVGKSETVGAKALGRFIKEQRKRLGLTQEELARKLRPKIVITRSALASYETGRITPPLAVLDELALSLGTDISIMVDIYRFPQAKHRKSFRDAREGLEAYAGILSMLSRMSPWQVEHTEEVVALLVRRDHTNSDSKRKLLR